MGFEKSRQAFLELTHSLDAAANELERVQGFIETSLSERPHTAEAPDNIFAGTGMTPESIKALLGD